LFWCGEFQKGYALVEELLGITLQDAIGSQFKIDNLLGVYKLAILIIEILEKLHNEGYVHRNISDSSICFGLQRI